MDDNDLKNWYDTLKNTQFEQRALRREASFHHTDIQQVNTTLSNLAPSNVADLAALILNILQELANKIRNGNTDDYLQYWNTLPDDNRKHEDICRDALLSDLQQRLSILNIDAQREGQYADNKRADIRVSFGGSNGFEVAIEIKKNNHQDLWRAIHNQLIPKYCRAPRSDGYGIYLVFWFGPKIKDIRKRKQQLTAMDLEKNLYETLTLDEKQKISICVIDVSKSR